MSKKPSYREAITWIALNDAAGEDWAESIYDVRHMVTVKLVADIFERSDYDVAKAVVEFRKRHDHDGNPKG